VNSDTMSGAGAACAADRLSTPTRLASAPSPQQHYGEHRSFTDFRTNPGQATNTAPRAVVTGIVTSAHRPLIRKVCSEQPRSAPAIARWDDSHGPSDNAGDDRPKCARTGPSRTRAPCTQF
jgi:hypothetical protein